MPDTKELQDLTQSYLSTMSYGDATFDDHKVNSQKLARLYGLDTADGFLGFMSGNRFILFSAYSDKVNKCGSWLMFVRERYGIKLKLADARFCKVPNCPMCQFRRSLKWRAKFLDLLPGVQEKFTSHRWLFLTLTIRNCELDDLKGSLKVLNTAFNRLSKNVKFPMVGLVKSVEVTRAWDCYDSFSGEFLGRHGSKWVFQYQQKHNTAVRLEPTTEVHPHLHVVGLVSSSYFGGKYYLKHSDWVDMWKKALRIDYTPIVNIKAVKCKKSLPSPKEFNSDNSLDNGMIAAICETLKYTVKEQDLIGSSCQDDEANSQWLKRVTEQLYKTRKVEYRGVLKEIGKELEEAYNSDDLITVKEDKEKLNTSDLEELTFTWYDALRHYVLRQDSVDD
jgi:plasmid rolling circle replication initiator protein Rep